MARGRKRIGAGMTRVDNSASGLLLVGAPCRLTGPRPGAPEADEAGDEGDKEELPGQHLEHGQDLADLTGRYQVAVADTCARAPGFSWV